MTNINSNFGNYSNGYLPKSGQRTVAKDNEQISLLKGGAGDSVTLSSKNDAKQAEAANEKKDGGGVWGKVKDILKKVIDVIKW
ncbi:hypothetical protein IJ818_00975 [bacterium]|nr:hypothetical protein [bacterium]